MIFLKPYSLEKCRLNQKTSPRGKRIACSKEALQSAPYKAAKITGFQFRFS